MPTEIGYRTLKILIQYMYSGEATVTNDQLEGVLKAGDILRVRGLWRSNNSGKKEIQSNNQKVERDKKEAAQTPGQIQKIKLVQPLPEKANENVQQTVNTTQNSNATAQKSSENNKLVDKIDDKNKDAESPKPREDNNEEESKSKGKNTETIGTKKRKSVNSETESNRTRSEAGDTVRYLN